ncbi:MAG: PD-(D/E)XK nuclease family protein [Endomicrobia bacterium]|nr:PD-(D/E)XK nuclease family protein [Endomicrobiia bacterium]MDW8055734.1 PD-(D/E)XK nuclease family protein [Elusimicrobiota bacterium]
MKNFNYYVIPMSANVIEFLIQHLDKNYNLKNLDRICIIFGGKRPSIVLNKQLANRIKRPFLPPKMFSVDEFVSYIVSKKYEFIAGFDLDIIYLIYDLCKNKEIFRKRFKDLIQFIPWGYEILHIINELWLENISPEKLKNIEIQAEIGFDIPAHINELLKMLSEIIKSLQDKLLNNKIAVRGFLYKLASESTQNLILSEFDEIIFVTPFFLHETEFRIVYNMSKGNNVSIVFQGDRKDYKQLENLSKKLNIDITIKENKENDRQIYFYSAFDKISEMNFVHKVLNNLDQKEIENTVIVLPNDDISTLILNFLPENVKEFNLVCGLPLKHSLLYTLFYTIFNAQINKKKKSYHTKDYLDVIKNPIAKKIITADQPQLAQCIIDTIEHILLGEIEVENISRAVFIDIDELELNEKLYYNIQKVLDLHLSVKDIKETIKKLHTLLFRQWEKINTFADLCSKIKLLLDEIVNSAKEPDETIWFTLAGINKLYEYLDRLSSTLFSRQKFNTVDIYKFILTEFERLRIPLSGSPVKGLQILGFYETRNLNFDNVIVVDLNESVLPYLKLHSSLVPRQVMLALGIDRIEIEEEIQRYHFTRLISQAKNVLLIYIESDEKEKSRFVEQLIWQQQQKHRSLDIKNMYFGYQKVSLRLNRPEVKKTDEIIKYLNQKEFSPTILDMYLQCPLKFYYSFVLSLEKVELTDEPESKDIGTFVHELLEMVFKDFLNKTPLLDEEFRKKFFEFFEHKFEKDLAKRFSSEAFLLKQVMRHFFDEFIKYEQKRVIEQSVNKILMLEHYFEDIMKFDSNKQIKFKYKIDRIDQLEDGSVLIIDYKTGAVEYPKKKLKFEVFSREIIKEQLKSFQLPLYIYIVDKMLTPKNSDAMFYDIKNPEKSKFLLRDHSEISKQEFLNTVLSALKHLLLNEILNQDIPFYADDSEERICNQCSFKYLCR